MRVVRNRAVRKKPCTMTNEQTSPDAVLNTGTVKAMITANLAPKFEPGSIAFRRTVSGDLQAWNVFEYRTTKRGREYHILRNGLLFWELESNLLSGWEDSFPGLEQVDWGDIQRSPGLAEKPAPEDDIISVYLDELADEKAAAFSEWAESYQAEPA